MASLYNLTGELAALNAALEAPVSDEEWVALMNGVNATLDEVETKLDGYARVVRNLTAESDALKAEEARLAVSRKTVENNVARLKDAVREAMNAVGKDKVKTGIGTWSIQLNPPAANVLDAEMIPENYKIAQPAKIDLMSIRDALKAGDVVPGVELVRGMSLRFR